MAEHYDLFPTPVVKHGEFNGAFENSMEFCGDIMEYVIIYIHTYIV
jgi:hypothetical protein